MFYKTPEVLFELNKDVALGRKMILCRFSLLHLTIFKFAYFTGNVFIRDDVNGTYELFDALNFELRAKFKAVKKLKWYEFINIFNFKE